MLGSVVLSARPRSTNFSIEAIISDTKREEEEDEDVDIEGEEDEDQGDERQESPVEEKFDRLVHLTTLNIQSDFDYYKNIVDTYIHLSAQTRFHRKNE